MYWVNCLRNSWQLGVTLSSRHSFSLSVSVGFLFCILYRVKKYCGSYGLFFPLVPPVRSQNLRVGGLRNLPEFRLTVNSAWLQLSIDIVSRVFENMKQNTVQTVFWNFVNFRDCPLMSRICTLDYFVINAVIDYL